MWGDAFDMIQVGPRGDWPAPMGWQIRASNLVIFLFSKKPNAVFNIFDGEDEGRLTLRPFQKSSSSRPASVFQGRHP